MSKFMLSWCNKINDYLYNSTYLELIASLWNAKAVLCSYISWRLMHSRIVLTKYDVDLSTRCLIMLKNHFILSRRGDILFKKHVNLYSVIILHGPVILSTYGVDLSTWY